MTIVSRADRALERVQDLYVVQTRLLKLLESDLGDPIVRKEAQASIREFKTLMTRVDWRYMGGEDVWESLKTLPADALATLKKSPSSIRHMQASAPAKKAVSAKAKSAPKAGKKKK